MKIEKDYDEQTDVILDEIAKIEDALADDPKNKTLKAKLEKLEKKQERLEEAFNIKEERYSERQDRWQEKWQDKLERMR